MLYRLGVNAYLTLGNKKAIDIIMANENKTITTIEVKGVAGPYDWPANNVTDFVEVQHFYILVSFEGKIIDPQFVPSAWIIPANKLKPFMQTYNQRVVIRRAAVKAQNEKYLYAWSQILEHRPI